MIILTIYEYANNTKSKNRKRNKTIRDHSFSKDIKYDFEYFIKLSEASFENIRNILNMLAQKLLFIINLDFHFIMQKNVDIRRSITSSHNVIYSYLTFAGNIRSKGGIYD